MLKPDDRYKTLLIAGLTILTIGFVNAQNRNFYLDGWKAKNFETPATTVKKTFQSGSASTTITLDPADTLGPVLPTQLGLNTTFRSGSEMFTERLDNYTNSGMGAFRFPAGSGSNLYFWDGNIPDEFLIDINNTIDGTVSNDLNIDEFVGFLDSTGAEATIVVNYFYARYGKTAEGTRTARVNQAADYAAAFVNYMNNVLNADVRNWEVGNECYGKWEVGFDVNGSIVTGKEYGEDFRIFAEKMKAVDPTIKVGAVMYPKSDDWNDQVMKEVKDHADFLVVHNYFTAEKDATVENVLASTGQINEIMQQMQSCVVRNTSYPADYFPLAMTEYNNRGPHTTTFINACFTADVLGRMMESGYGLATRWVGEWKWKVGTHGLFAVEDPDQKDYTVRQAYMIYRYLDLAFGDQLIKTISNNSNLWVYGSRFSDGKYGIMVINRTGFTQSFNVKIAGEGLNGKAWWYEVYANSINEGDKKFYVNGLTSATTGGGPADFTSIKPYESDVQAETEFTVRKYSVSFFVVDPQRENSFPRAENDRFEIDKNTVLTASVADNDSSSEDGNNTYHVLDGTQHGTVSMSTDGVFIYTPETAYVGFDSFSYILCDTDNDCDTAQVVVELKNPLSVYKQRIESFLVYPNPTSGSINFRNSGKFNTVVIYAMNGKKLRALPFEDPLDLSFLKKGTYLLELLGKSNRYSSLITKE